MVIPEYISLIDWADNLIVDYPLDDLPILQNEEEWIEWAENVISKGEFFKRECPSPVKIDSTGRTKEEKYKDWQEWARVIYIIMSTNIGKKLKEKNNVKI